MTGTIKTVNMSGRALVQFDANNNIGWFDIELDYLKVIDQPLPKPEEKGLGFEPLPGPRGVADDLKKLTGVSPPIEKKLNDLGIFHFSQIAELSAEAAHNVGEEVGLPGRVQGWVAKAKELTAE